MGSLYERIDSLCAEKGIKLGKMCNDLGISRGSMGDLKKGRRDGISTKTATKIADYFGVTTDYLLGAEPEKAPTLHSEHELPHSDVRTVLAEGGLHLLMDADAKMPEEHLEEIVEFIKMKQRKYGR